MRIAASSTTQAPPAERAEAAFRQDLMSLQGARYTYVDPTDPGRLVIEFETPDLRRLADNVLRDGIVGARLLLTSPPGEPSPPLEPGKQAWYDSTSAMARSVDAMPGVLYHHWAGHLGEAIFFRVTTREVARHLEQLVTPLMGTSTVYFVPVTS